MLQKLVEYVKQNLSRKEDGIPLPAKAGSFLPYIL